MLKSVTVKYDLESYDPVDETEFSTAAEVLEAVSRNIGDDLGPQFVVRATLVDAE